MLTSCLKKSTMISASKQETGCVPADSVLLAGVNRASQQAFFLEGFRHAISNPVNSIQMGGQLLRSCIDDITRFFDLLEDDPDRLPFISAELRETFLTTMPRVVDGINSSARGLVQSVSRLSLLTAGGAGAGSRDIDFNQLVSHCVSMTSHRICRFTDNLRLDLASAVPPVNGNPQEFQQAVINLLINALLSLPEKNREVIISTSDNRDTGQVQFRIEDRGTGIAPDIFPHIIDPFFTTWGKHGCVGLGLTVTDLIVRNHGGTLTIDSEAGRGTRAVVSLPVCERTSGAREEPGHE